MRKLVLFLVIFTVFQTFFLAGLPALKVLHLSFHQGCINDIKEVAHELGWDLTTWNPLSSRESAIRFLGSTEDPRGAYNMTHERAERIWTVNWDYFIKFDLIITSDTAPLSRIFLQNKWTRPLIIWVCNRFNYCVGPGSEGGMDQEYYRLFNEATKMKNVRIVAYTPFEHYFAALYKVDMRGPVIKPIGIFARNMHAIDDTTRG